MQTTEFYSPDPALPMIIPPRSPSPDITYPYPLFKPDEEHKRAAMKPNQDDSFKSPFMKPKQVSTVVLHGVRIVCLLMDGKERLCLAQISNTLLKEYSYNEIHNRRVALGITCVQCTPVQLEILRRAGAMPISSRRCGMITKREAERLCKSFLGDNTPPKLPENFAFECYHECAWGCRGQFVPSRYNSSRAKCIKCHYCGVFFSPNKFVFHSHRLTDSDKYVQPDAANFNSWRRHTKLLGDPPEAIVHAWEDVKAMFNGGTRKRLFSESSGQHASPSTPTSTTLATGTPTASPVSSRPSSKSSKSSKTNNNNNNNSSENSSTKSEKKSSSSNFFKPAFMHPLLPPPAVPHAPSGYFPAPFESCLDTFAAAAAALNTTEKTEKVAATASNGGGNSGESTNSLGISADYHGLWPHPPGGTSNGFPFPYPFFWPSKRPQAPFTPFHTSLLGATTNSLLKEEDMKLVKDSPTSVLQWMEQRRRRSGFFFGSSEESSNPIFPLDSDLAKRNSFAHFSAFRPVAKIGDILQLSSSSTTSASGAAAASIQDSGEICEVSTTVDKDEESDSSPKAKADELIDVENEEKAREVKSEPQDFSVRKIVQK